MLVEQTDRQPRSIQRGPRILREGAIESLVAQGRIPLVDEVQIGIGGRQREYHCYIPLEDTSIGDRTGYLAGVRIFQSPEGEMRGRPTMVVLKASQARQVEERSTSLSWYLCSNDCF